MKHVDLLHAISGSTALSPLRASSYALALFTIVTSSNLLAQAPESTDGTANSNGFSAEALSNREEELRRKEAELLQAISSGSTTSQSTQPLDLESPISASPTTTDAIRISPPIEAPVQAVVNSEPVPAKTEPSAEFQALKEMGNHPALEKKKVIPPAAPQPAKFTTHGSSSGSRKLDTFRRVERDTDRNDYVPNLYTNPRTVSLQEIESERDRPAPYQYVAVATIAGRDATLRTGPRTGDRTLGSAPRFSEVRIDYRSGDWYRVQTGTGLRGWIQGRNLLFDAGISHNSTVRIGAVKSENAYRAAYRR